MGPEDDFRDVIDALPQIVWITRPDGWHFYYNRQWMDFTGLTLEESLGRGWNPPFHPDDRDRAARLWERATRTGEPYEVEYRLRRADGVYVWMLGRASPLRDDTGQIVKWFGTCTDIQQLKRAQARVGDQARLLDQTQDGIVVLDLEHRVVYWNRGAERIHGWSSAEAVGRPLDQLLCRDLRQVDQAVEAVLAAGDWSGELRFVDRDGAELLMEGRWTLLRHEDGSPRAVLAVNTDVTERRAIEVRFLEELEVRATRDPLTGLANRSLLFDRLELLLAQRHGTGLAVAFIDLDGFKSINDLMGHRTGDQVLMRVAERLQSAVRHGDIVARIGGDEFVVVGEAEDDQMALHLGERLAAAVSRPTMVDGHTLPLSASVGVAFTVTDSSSDADELLSRADAVMYEVKRSTPGSAGLEPAERTAG